MKQLIESFLFFWISVLFSLITTALHLHGVLAIPLMIMVALIILLLFPVAYLVRDK